MDLFGYSRNDRLGENAPLAARMRPASLEEILGQDHLLAPGKLLRRSVESDRLGSIILYGPPGCGKTSLAEVIARATRRRFERVSGVQSNVAALRRVMESACALKAREGEETILFIDEIHHFNKSQQDVLLPFVEDGSVTLIGATTHNPFFFINSPLLSRSQIFEMAALCERDTAALLRRALADKRGLASMPLDADEDALLHIAKVCEGDARRALNAIEIAALSTRPGADGRIRITRAIAAEATQKKAVVYDHDEDGHYDTISAFIKSVRGTDPDAAIYWLAKMLYAGEDPRFIARRLVILASEDVGNADPRAIMVAVAAKDAVEFVGMPEARIILSHATAYIACAPKSNSAYLAIEKAMADVKAGRVLEVPKHLRGSNYKGAEQLGHTGYKYAHDYAGHFVDQEYMPSNRIYYEPTSQGHEEYIKNRLERVRAARRQAAGDGKERDA